MSDPFERIIAVHRRLNAPAPQEGELYPDVLEKVASLMERLESVAAAALQTKAAFMAIDDGFFTGLVPPEMGPICAALRALAALSPERESLGGGGDLDDGSDPRNPYGKSGREEAP